MGIRIDNVHKQFRDFPALRGVNLDVRTGELIALLGPSGCGKTTLLRIIAGLEYADSGEIYLDVASDSPAPASRRVGFVFQHYALFRHMSVFDNIAFGLRVKKKSARLEEAEIRRKVMSLIDLIHLEGMHNRYPSELSGGQRQRVALARTLAVDPKVLLLDEPFGALDAKVRKELRRWLRNLHKEIPITTIFVTHDHEEAMDLANRVVVMNEGRVEQIGLPEEIYNHPANAFVYDFLGNYNSFSGWRDGKTGASHLLLPGQNLPEGMEPVALFARPHDMDVALQPQDNNAIAAQVVHINQAGPLISIEAGGKSGEMFSVTLSKEQFARLRLDRGATVFLKPKNMKAFRS